MFGKKKKKSSGLSEIERASRELLDDINELEELINKRATRVMQPERNTLPPPDRVRESRQHRTLKVAVNRGNVRNVRREIFENTFLLVLLVAAIAASAYWVLRLLEQA